MGTNDIQAYYNQGREQERLKQSGVSLELIRTQEIILRYLQKPPLKILDVGGGAGIYALWLAQMGHEVHLVDLMSLHVEQALKASEAQPDHPSASARVGDALHLEIPDASVDAVLLLGPLYHLPERNERVQALREAYRVLKPSGVLLAAAISRFASLMDGLKRGYLADDQFASLVEQDLMDGQHRNPTGQPGYFTTAYFHYPTELQAELGDAGFHVEGTIAVEGPATFTPDLDAFWSDEKLRERVLGFLRTVESEPTMLGATGHLLAVGRKK